MFTANMSCYLFTMTVYKNGMISTENTLQIYTAHHKCPVSFSTNSYHDDLGETGTTLCYLLELIVGNLISKTKVLTILNSNADTSQSAMGLVMDISSQGI